MLTQPNNTLSKLAPIPPQSLAIVVPVYHNESSLEALHQQVRALPLDEIERCLLVFVNDGSKDASWEVLKKIKEKDTDICLISFTRNFGQIAAIKAGLRAATNVDWVAIISADLQDPIDLIPKMLKHGDEQTDLVIAYRKDRSDGWLNKMGSRFFYKLINHYNKEVPVGGFDCALMSQKVIPHWLQFNGRHRFMQADLLSLGFPTKFIPYHRKKREKGKSQNKLKNKIKYFIDGFLRTSYSPIRWMSSIGLLSLMLGVIYSILIVYNYFMNDIPFKGWAPLMILILILGGLNLCFLGILGEYIWRIFDNMDDRPEYIIKEKID